MTSEYLQYRDKMREGYKPKPLPCLKPLYEEREYERLTKFELDQELFHYALEVIYKGECKEPKRVTERVAYAVMKEKNRGWWSIIVLAGAEVIRVDNFRWRIKAQRHYEDMKTLYKYLPSLALKREREIFNRVKKESVVIFTERQQFWRELSL